MNKILTFYYQSFIRIKGWLLILISSLISIIPIYFTWEKTIQLKYLLPIALILIISLFVIIDASFVMWRKHMTLPRVIQGRKPPKLYDNVDKKSILLILEKSKIYNIDTAVTIYEMDNEYEKLIGLGRVLLIQDNGLIQVLCWNFGKTLDQIWKKASANDGTVLKKLVVKPVIPYQYSNFEGI